MSSDYSLALTYIATMTREEAISIITATLPSLDDEEIKAVADIVQTLDKDQRPLRQLTPREQALLERSKEDFKAGLTYSHDQLTAMLDERLALRGVPKSAA